MLKTIIMAGMGSCLGGIVRYLASRFIQEHVMCSFPLGTWIVNILGCFAIGLFYGLFEQAHLMNSHLKLFLTVGFCGGFTTFSTFMNENFQLIRDGNFYYFALYTGLSLLIGFLMLMAGYSLVKLF
ncbi:MAG: fluoride efflux transporter CrcB [Parabacteroides sp.]|nr:fluoride efflux transporter CrcB [Parabacteroides sp.]